MISRPLASLLVLFASAGYAQADKTVSVSLNNALLAGHYRGNTNIVAGFTNGDWLKQTDGMKYDDQLLLNVIVSPTLTFEDNFQSEAKIDLYFSKTLYSTNIADITINEAYVDLLFYDLISVRSGYFRVDYGYNGYFHPLNADEIIPGFSDTYRKITIGTDNKGIPGVPAASIKASVPRFIDDLNISLNQTVVLFNTTNLSKEFYLSSLAAVYGSFNLGLLAAYSDGYKPVFGASLAFLLPFKIMLFGELLYKSSSFRPFIQNGCLVTNRDSNFYNAMARLEYSDKEPLFNNTLSWNIEYFYYGEGLDDGMYGGASDYLGSPINFVSSYAALVRTERNFQHYLEFELSYTLQNKWFFTYRLVSALHEGVLSHLIYIGKSFENSTISVAGLCQHSLDGKYEITYYGNDLGAQISLDIEM